MFKSTRGGSSHGHSSDRGGAGKKFGGDSYGKRRPFDRGESRGDDRDGAKTPSFEAVCGGCGKDCKVPFRPSGTRPVYCTNCFKKEGNGGGEAKPFSGSSYGRPQGREGRPAATGGNADIARLQDQLRQINTKLDAILHVLDT